MIETLVNLPLILHIDEATAIGPVTGDLVGHRITITATATSYTWTIGSQTLTTTETGMPWSEEHACSARDCAAYLHSEPFAKPGQYSVQLLTHWSARYQIDDGPWIDFPESFAKTSTALAINVREARGELVSGEN